MPFDWQQLLSAPKHVWKTFERVCIAMFTTKATLPLGLVLCLGILVHKLTSSDLKDLLVKLVDASWFCALGWVLFAVTLAVGKAAFSWREKIYQNELNRIQGVKDKIVKGQLEIEFPPQPPKK